MTATALESKAAFARRIGVNKSTITRAAQAGRLVMQGSKVDVAQSLARWHATAGGRADLTEKHAQQRGQTIPQASLPTPEQKSAKTGVYSSGTGKVAAFQPSAPSAIGVDDEATRTDYKATTLLFENETIKLQMALERLIDQTAPRLAAESQRDARAALLHEECAALARSIKAEFVRSARRLRQQKEKSNG